MRLLLDSSIWPRTVAALRASGHDVDKDFGELAVRHGLRHSGIVRLVLTPVSEEARLCERVLALYGAELANGAIVTAAPERIRIRLPER